MGSESYESFINNVLQPKNFKSLKEPFFSVPIRIRVYENPNSTTPSKEFVFRDENGLYPFQTVAELCTHIYIESGERDEFHPENQCLLKPTQYEGKFVHFQYSLLVNKPIDLPIELDSPFTLLASNTINPNFVDQAGNSKFVKVSSRLHVLLESALPTNKNTLEHVLHLYLYSNIYEIYTGVKPVNRTHWEGIFRVYFPEREKQYENGSLTPEAEEYKKILVKRFLCRKKMIEVLNDQLESEPTATERKPGESSRGNSIRLSNIRNLRFRWNPPSYERDERGYNKYKSFDIESLFYDTSVSELIPYIRFYPISSEHISKVHVKGGILNIPSLEKPELLGQWSSELKSPTPEENVVMLKILLRAGGGSVNPLFATMFIHQDGSAKLIIQPDTDTRALNITTDLYNLANILKIISNTFPKLYPTTEYPNMLARTLYRSDNISLDDAYIILSLNLELDDTNPITKKSLEKVLKYYIPFFQKSVSPLKFQNPIAFLRFKGVDNFQSPARDFQFLHRIIDLQKLQGKTLLQNLVPYYIEQFDVPISVAQTRVASFLQDMTRFVIINPETLEYKQEDNPGIDVALFGRFPSYTVHIYRVDSLTSLRRIKTLFTLLINLGKDLFEDIDSCLEISLNEDSEQQEQSETRAAAERVEAAEDDDEEYINPLPEVITDSANLDEFLFDLGGIGEESAIVEPLESVAAVAEPEKDEQGSVASSDADDDDEITDVVELKKTKAKTYFLKRLNFYDQRLFQYTKSHPSLKKYSSMCAANALKQPTVMSIDDFERMKQRYATDNNHNKTSVVWKKYPIPKGEKVPEEVLKADKNTEIITYLQYGSSSDATQENIYICCQYWCRQDDIVVLEKDYFSPFDRNGRNKPVNKEKGIGSCPFCHNGPVKERLKIVKGETVIDRSAKAKSTEKKRHLYINFLKKTVHPEGLYLPCCFLKDKEIFEDKHPAFSYKKEKSQEAASGEPLVASMARNLEPRIIGDERDQFTVDYSKKLGNNKSWYILGAEKLPLEVLREGPQIGILPPIVDKFFSQDSRRDLVVNDHTVWKLITKGRPPNDYPNASGFLRIGVENRKRYQADSFLAAIAPFYGKNSASEIKSLLMQPSLLGNPNVFLSLNYGNFLFDFFDPTLPEPNLNEIHDFAVRRIGIETGYGVHKEALIRWWKGFAAFNLFMQDPTKIKEFRHFAKLLCLPNMLQWQDGNETRSNGIIFIILEVSTKDGTMEIRCPPYGISPRNSHPTEGCDVAFIIYYKSSGIWEPLIYTDNNIDENINHTYTVFRRDTQAGWPKIVKQRVAEYEAMCHSSGLGIYTDSTIHNTKSLLPLSVATELGLQNDIKVEGILRDTYNHISAVVFKIKENENSLVIVPVIDDGTIYPNTKIELDWMYIMTKLASGSDAEIFYKTKLRLLLEKKLPHLVNYYISEKIISINKTITKDPATGKQINSITGKPVDPTKEPLIYGLKLANGLFVPVKDADSVSSDIEYESEGKEAPWMIDIKLAFGMPETPANTTEINSQDFEEIYQHLRFTFANWVAILPPNVRKEFDDILYKDGKPNRDLSLNEKRKRFLIKIGYTIYSWLDSSITQPNINPSIKRIDCRVSTENQCSNRCIWKKEKNACYLHVPDKYRIGKKNVDAKSLMIKKLIEELIRFPLKREELLNKNVRKYIKLTQGFRSGDEYIVPENSGDWFELLRMEWNKNYTEQPKYLEEFSSIQPLLWTTGTMPEILTKSITPYTFIIPLSNTILTILEKIYKISPKILQQQGQNIDNPILSSQEICNFVAETIKLSVIQLVYEDFTPTKPNIFAKKIMINEKEKIQAPYLCIVKIGKQLGKYEDGVIGIVSGAPESVQPIKSLNFLQHSLQRDIQNIIAKQKPKASQP